MGVPALPSTGLEPTPPPCPPHKGEGKAQLIRHLLHERVGQLEVAVDVLHVVMLLQRLHQPHELLAGLVVDGDRGLRLPDQLGGLRLAELRLRAPW